MGYSFTCCAKVIVQIAMLEITLNAAFARDEARSEKTRGPLPISAEPVAGYPIPLHRTTVPWDGQEYDIDTAIDVLMNVVRDPKTSRHDRELALIHLTMAGTHLRGHPCLRELEILYDKGGELEKQEILLCFLGSRDPRAVALSSRVLEKEQDMKLRLTATSVLAGWNIRRGVAELVKLVESQESLPPPARMPYVRDYALESFHHANTRKGWGLNDEETRKSIEDRAQNREEFVLLYAVEIKKWFAENEHRFPDWKPGDALPEVEANQEKPAEANDK